jgi:membrane protease YdiL (CAAX protease family)
MSIFEKIVPALAFALAVAAAADPALAQFSGGGADAPFQEGLGTLLNWVFIVGVVVALGAFLFACIMLFNRNLMGFAGGLLGVVVGGALMANAADIVNGLTGLENVF